MTALVLRRANVSRISGEWQHEDFDVFDGERDVGRIYLVDSNDGQETWFWGVSFLLTNRTSYGRAQGRVSGMEEWRRLMSAALQCARMRLRASHWACQLLAPPWANLGGAISQ
jgi:hypothetical protein